MLSSNGGAALHVGGRLGQYDFDEDRGYYVQTSTEQSDEHYYAAYLFPINAFPENGWWVGRDPYYSSIKYIRNVNPIKTVDGWQYLGCKEVGWCSDPTMILTPGPLRPLATQFNVTASGAAEEKWSSYLGVFNRTERWFNGRPVYVNTYGRLLYHDDPGWAIGNKLGSRALRGSRSFNSPDTEDSWTYWTGSERRPGSVTVTAL